MYVGKTITDQGGHMTKMYKKGDEYILTERELEEELATLEDLKDASCIMQIPEEIRIKEGMYKWIWYGEEDGEWTIIH
jgi:hypothetical protein